MGKTSSEVKNRYNKKAYTQYTFSVRKDDSLHDKIEGYKKEHPQGFAVLVKTLLDNYFSGA